MKNLLFLTFLLITCHELHAQNDSVTSPPKSLPTKGTGQARRGDFAIAFVLGEGIVLASSHHASWRGSQREAFLRKQFMANNQ